MKNIRTATVMALGTAMILTGSANAVITVVNNNNALALATALATGAGITVNSATLSGQSGVGTMSTGLYTTTGDAYGLGLGGNPGGIVMSTGDAQDYGTGPNTSGSFTTAYGVAATPAQEALLDPITGGTFTHFDVSVLSIDFTPNPGVTGITFNAVFGSDEFFEFVGTSFIDGFGLYLNGVNIAFNAAGPMNINNPSAANVVETELDGVIINPQSGIPLQFFGGNVNPGMNNLTIVVGDASDASYDTTVYLSGLGVPAPGAMALLGLAGLVGRGRRRH
jgi:hypothetical protein